MCGILPEIELRHAASAGWRLRSPAAGAFAGVGSVQSLDKPIPTPVAHDLSPNKEVFHPSAKNLEMEPQQKHRPAVKAG
jgi:hypothetical protein